MTDDPYVYPGTRILQNKLGVRSAAKLDAIERRLVAQRARERVPTGDFDLAHLCAIHLHLFQDIYDWAGEIRSIEISKDNHQFMFRQFIHNGMADVHRRIVAANFFRKSTMAAFAEQAGVIMGDVNYVHPFREGNGRTQMLWLQQLAARAGRTFEIRKIVGEEWMHASKCAHASDYEPMRRAIFAALS